MPMSTDYTVHIVDALPSDVELRRGWDLAASGAEQGESPDYTAGVLAGVRHADRSVWIADAARVVREDADSEPRPCTWWEYLRAWLTMAAFVTLAAWALVGWWSE